ncbi:MAG: helix-turn-helix domain-containing protein, partial [Phycisphaerae bacterium]
SDAFMARRRSTRIGRDLRRAMKASDLSVYMIAKQAGLAVGVVQRIDKGERVGMTLRTAERIAKTLGLRIVLQPIEEREG